MFEIGQIYEVVIDKMTFGGEGIARIGKFVVFVPESMPGDKLKVKITEVKKNYGRGEIVEIITPSPNRIEPPCKYYAKCGGCSFQHIDYKEQLRLKKEIVEDSFFRFAKGLDIKINDCVASDNVFKFRNKIQWVASASENKNIFGLYEKNTHNVIDIDYCLIADEQINNLSKLIRQKIVGADPFVSPNIKHILIRKSSHNGKLVVVFIAAEKADIFKKIADELTADFPDVSGVILNINPDKTNVVLGKENITLAGDEFISEKAGDLIFYYHGVSFFQVNPPQLNKIIKTIADNVSLSEDETVLDLYSGVGVLSMHLAGKCKKITLVEDAQKTEESVKKILKENNIRNVELINTGVDDALKKIAENKEKIDLIILDPPRKGCTDAGIEYLKSIGAPKIIYLSCNPATLARDCKLLTSAGYKISFAQPFDMFPQTYHVETLIIMTNDKFQMSNESHNDK